MLNAPGSTDTHQSTADTFDDFPEAPAALIGNVNYISIPSGGSITGCNLYK